MESSQKIQAKLDESIKEQCKNGGMLCIPIFIALVFYIAVYLFVERRLGVTILMFGGILIQLFVVRTPFINALKIKKLKKRIENGETSVEVEQRKIKAFNLVKDTIEDEDGNIIKVVYTTNDEYYYLAGEDNVTLVTVEGKVYAFAINRF
ncbi:hypothetical protein [Lachnobacterium bovis]|uniref:hypothetical protein n=1 Tax=Lachnobacterium bovis TaxID=140626 RepID=UPI00048154B9|nr:hypothetical protein [Lachnobacterium bovis]